MMRGRALLIMSALVAVTALPSFAADPLSPADRNGIAFDITAATETAEGRTPVADAVIAGPSGTDFDIALDAGRFRMSAQFLTELNPGGRDLRVVAVLDTKRLYGTSERGLPLYEEDHQNHSFRLGFDEQLVLLPFGGRDREERLVIDIVPRRVHLTSENLQIHFNQQSGNIRINASRRQHRFATEAEVIRGGKVVARGSARSFLGDSATIRLAALDPAARFQNLDLVLTIQSSEPRPPDEVVQISFDLLRRGSPLLQGWAGAGTLGGDLVYDLHQVLGGDQPLQLRIVIRPDR